MYITAEQAREMRITDKKRLQVYTNLLVCDILQKVESAVYDVALLKPVAIVPLPELYYGDINILNRVVDGLKKDGYSVVVTYSSAGHYPIITVRWSDK